MAMPSIFSLYNNHRTYHVHFQIAYTYTAFLIHLKRVLLRQYVHLQEDFSSWNELIAFTFYALLYAIVLLQYSILESTCTFFCCTDKCGGSWCNSCLLGKSEIAGSNPTLAFKFQRNKMFLHRSLANIQYCGEPPWPIGSVLGLRPPGLEFRILCPEGSVILFISPSSGGSSGSVWPICAQRWPEPHSFHLLHR